MRYAPLAMALALSSIVSASPAHAGRSHINVAVVATFGHSPFFFDPFFHRPFLSQPFCHPFCRSAFFFGGPVFAPPPVFYSPPVYYAPPVYYYPPPAYYAPPAAAAPPSQGGSPYKKEDCRQTETTITIDGQAQRLVGTVCKGPDGNWHTAP
jgi:hypothetical protein